MEPDGCRVGTDSKHDGELGRSQVFPCGQLKHLAIGGAKLVKDRPQVLVEADWAARCPDLIRQPPAARRSSRGGAHMVRQHAARDAEQPPPGGVRWQVIDAPPRDHERLSDDVLGISRAGTPPAGVGQQLGAVRGKQVREALAIGGLSPLCGHVGKDVNNPGTVPSARGESAGGVLGPDPPESGLEGRVGFEPTTRGLKVPCSNP